MIEILFAESEAASMKEAKHRSVIIGSAAEITAEKTEEKELPKKLPKKLLPGWGEGRQEVLCLGFMLDAGDIKQPVDGPYRKKLIVSMYAQNQWERDERREAELIKSADVYADELRRLQRFLDKGEAIRIWYSDAPYSRCGFYHLCHFLNKYENEIRVVKLPEYAVRERSIVSYKNWGEVAAEEFAGFLPEEKKLSKEELRLYAILWSELVEDNSPLRALVNGRLLSVPEDFYDFQIFKRLTDKPVKEARLLGDILGYFPISVGDWWYAKRIEFYIRQGKIRVVEDSEKKYARMISLEKSRL